MRPVILLSLFAILATACVSKRKLHERLPEPTENFTFTTGLYSNMTNHYTANQYQTCLMRQLNRRMNVKDTIEDWRDAVIKLERIKKGLSIDIILADTVVEHRKLRGKWQGNRFTSRRYILPLGLPPVLYHYHERVAAAEFHPDSVNAAHGETSQGMILLFGAGVDGGGRGTYYQVSDSTAEYLQNSQPIPPKEYPSYTSNKIELIKPIDTDKDYPQISIEFTIDTDGSVKDVRLIDLEDSDLTGQSRMSLMSMPKWTPGRKNGEKVRMKVVRSVYIH